MEWGGRQGTEKCAAEKESDRGKRNKKKPGRGEERAQFQHNLSAKRCVLLEKKRRSANEVRARRGGGMLKEGVPNGWREKKKR